ncbi:MAG: sodium:solute symporter [Candidatus Marinimicrobia bacterium]|nr:sodium:solute symporter [Candidatus Neomarinimicrobiota bacterium]
MVSYDLHTIDLTIIAVYAVFIVILGVWLGKQHKNAEDYFLAGRSMTWSFIGISLFASNISSTTLIGLAGDAYSTGISVFNYEWFAVISLIVFAMFFLPFILRSQVYTMPEFLERRFDRRARNYFSLLTLFLNIVVDTAGSLYAGALMLKLIFPTIPTWETIAVLAVVAGAYTIAGGLAAVIYTDTIQAILLVFGSIIIAVLAFDQVGGWAAITAEVPQSMLSLIRPLDDPGVPWLGLFTGVPLLGFYFWCTNQFMVQRMLSAKNLDHGRWGALFAGFLKLPVLFLMVLPGTFAILLYPDLPKPDLVYPTLLFDLLPVGVLGLVLAGFIAALMSQIDSTLNSASTLVTMDFIRLRKPELSNEALLKVGRWVTFGFMILAALWAPQIENFGSLFKYLQRVLSYTVPPVVAMFIGGIFSAKVNKHGAFASLIVGLSLGVMFFLSNEILHWTSVHFLYIAPILFVFSYLALVLGSRLNPVDEAATLVWNRAFFHAESQSLQGVSWYRNYRILSILLAIITIFLVGSFW